MQQNDPVKPPPLLLDRKENAARMRSAENIHGGEFGGTKEEERRNEGQLVF
jgi:hypothetical protein